MISDDLRDRTAWIGGAVRLRSVQIVNFRNFADLTIDPFPTPAVIVGENGAGKSNLLHALRLVLDPDLSARRRQLQVDDVHDGSTPLADGVEVSVEIELTDFDADDDAKAELDGAIISTSPYIARLTYLFSPKKSVGVVLGTSPGRPLTPEDYEWTIFGANDRTRSMVGATRYAAMSVLPALRNAEEDLGRADRNPLMRVMQLLPPDPANQALALQQMQAARAELGRDPNVREIQRLLRGRVSTMAGPQLEVVLSLAFAGRTEDLLRSVKLFVDAAGTRGIDRTSTGAANIIYLALLLERLRLRKTGGDRDTLLAVEEPEAHLHPTLQRHVFRHLLREPDRLVLTTHSPHIAAVTPLSSLVVLAQARGASTARAVPPGLLSPADTADLERYLNVTRAEILFARHVILVEGAAEGYLLPALAEAAEFDLDGHGIVVAAVDGTDFMPYARLLGLRALDRPFSVLTDGDVTDDTKAHKAEPGLSRACVLTGDRDEPEAEDLAERLSQMVSDNPAADPRPGRDDLVEEASDNGLYVGHHTLETDIAALLAEEMVDALVEFGRDTPQRRERAKALVQACRPASSTAFGREALLTRIENIGKGRYAQRLAAHVSAMDLRARVTALLGVHDDDEITRADLLGLPGCGPLLALLDDLRRSFEGLPLLPTDDELEAWQLARQELDESEEAGDAAAGSDPADIPEIIIRDPVRAAKPLRRRARRAARSVGD